MTESRLYTALAYSAFKNHPQCFKIIYSHGCKFNLPQGPNKKPTPKSLQTWANQQTDEQFTALHFSTYHGNFEIIKILVEEMFADINARNVYGANVLHIAS
jgi:ankyrin repeat protein